MYLLLASADRGEPVLPDSPPIDTVPALRSRGQRVGKELWDAGGDPNDLTSQGWAAVVPTGAAGIEAALAPLVEARSRGMGKPATVLRAPAGAGKAWVDAALARAFPRELDRPRYGLVVGSYAVLGADLDAAWATEASVGRLPVDDPEAVAAYVAKVAAAERTEAAEAALDVCVPDDDTMAILQGRTLVIDPTIQACRSWATSARRPLAIEERRLVTGGSAPVVLTLSHGAGPPQGGWRTREEQERGQGELVWGPKERVGPDEVGTGRFAPGGAWVCWACFGAGTPAHSVYAPWLEKLAAREGYGPGAAAALAGIPQGPGFASATALAALANPDGPLVVVGHLDLAWLSAVLTAAGRPRPGAVEEISRVLLAGHRAGLAMDALRRATAQADTELALAIDRGGPDAIDTNARLWMRRHDLAGWVLLGDPAVRVTKAAAVRRDPRVGEADSGLPPLPVGRAGTTAPVGLPPLPDVFPKARAMPALPPLPGGVATSASDPLEIAILDLLRGVGDPAALARSAGVSVADLRRFADAWRDAGRRAVEGMR